MADIAKLGDELLALTVLEAKELNDYLEERGIKAAAAVAVAERNRNRLLEQTDCH